MRSFIQYSFVPVVAIAFLMIFEQFVFRYVTTLPPMITQAEYGIYALQAFAVIATFCMGILLVPSLTQSIFSGGERGERAGAADQRRPASSRGEVKRHVATIDHGRDDHEETGVCRSCLELIVLAHR